MEEHFVGKVAQKAIIEKDGKVLIVRDVRDVDLWELPGGRLNKGEIPGVGLKRELREELGADIEIHELVHIEQFVHTQKGDPCLFLIFRASLVDVAQMFVLQVEEIAEVKWISKSELYDQGIYETYLRGLEVYFKVE